MNRDEILIIKAGYPVKKTVLPIIYRNILEQMENGLVILPFGYEVVTVPKDIEVEFGDVKDPGLGYKDYGSKYEGIPEKSEEELWCTECPYFKYVADDMDDSWYGAKCNWDGHEANPSMYAVQSLHDDCPFKKEEKDEGKRYIT